MKGYCATGCLFLGILCFLYFFGILIYAGIRTSIVWTWAIFGAGFLFLWKALLYQESHPGSPVRYLTGAAGICIAAGLITVTVLGSRIIRCMTAKPEPGLEYVIVLGAQINSKKPSRALRRRLDAAYDYVQENPDTLLILSGGQGPDEEISEAECMETYLLERGMNSRQLLLEDRSESTWENLIFSDQLYQLQDKKVGILSNDFHVYRALCLAEKAGYQNPRGICATSDPGMQPHNILREILCILLAVSQGKMSL